MKTLIADQKINKNTWKNAIVWFDGKMSQIQDFDGGDKFKIKLFVSGNTVWVDKSIIVWS
tara:strand:- start:259 stop:438 length:180 start_codon:yes stop_codon:yes gene_type:complete